MGEDTLGVTFMKSVGLSARPAARRPQLDAVVDWRATVRGGRGAVSTFAGRILRAQGKWEPIIAAELAEE